ncbi:hypothetical protein ACFX1X_004641 [Malus domestica]
MELQRRQSTNLKLKKQKSDEESLQRQQSEKKLNVVGDNPLKTREYQRILVENEESIGPGIGPISGPEPDLYLNDGNYNKALNVGPPRHRIRPLAT